VFSRRIAVIGTGYVGLTTGACLASLGHHVVYADVNEAKIERLRTGAGGCEPSCPPLVAVPLSYSNDEPVVAIIDAARSTKEKLGFWTRGDFVDLHRCSSPAR